MVDFIIQRHNGSSEREVLDQALRYLANLMDSQRSNTILAENLIDLAPSLAEYFSRDKKIILMLISKYGIDLIAVSNELRADYDVIKAAIDQGFERGDLNVINDALGNQPILQAYAKQKRHELRGEPLSEEDQLLIGLIAHPYNFPRKIARLNELFDQQSLINIAEFVFKNEPVSFVKSYNYYTNYFAENDLNRLLEIAYNKSNLANWEIEDSMRRTYALPFLKVLAKIKPDIILQYYYLIIITEEERYSLLRFLADVHPEFFLTNATAFAISYAAGISLHGGANQRIVERILREKFHQGT
jgi:hypothetical protein